ncbi:MAG: hypothetical protein RLZ74_809 [Actinomycetota bacterium]
MEGRVDVVIVGAGFAGMYMLHSCRQAGLSAIVYERGGGVGGTWYWNRYPGARCDVPSLEYSYQFSEDLQQEWEWTEKYATQPEILRYAEHVADRFDLKRDIRFDALVTSITYDEETNLWTTTLKDGATTTSRFVVSAVGCLSSANRPRFTGDDTFSGRIVHTGEWPHDGVDFSGKRVAVIGTGSSGIQAIPIIAEQCDHLTVFQRTASFTIPAHNAPLDPQYVRSIKSDYSTFRAKNMLTRAALGGDTPTGTTSASEVSDEELDRVLSERWAKGGLLFLGGFNDSMVNKASNDRVANWVRNKISSIVRDPRTAKLLQPDTVIGCKRLVVDSGYYDTFNRPNVSLVNVSDQPIERFTEDGIIVGGTEHPVDIVVLATGFDAMTGSLLKLGITGRNGTSLADAWSAGPVNYLGLTVHGFPNFFMITGPGSPSVLTNVLVSIQHHVEWITATISHLAAHGHSRIEATQEAQESWVSHVNGVASMTLFPSCNSWYLGANIPGKPRIFMPLPGFPDYVSRVSRATEAHYEGFALTN